MRTVKGQVASAYFQNHLGAGGTPILGQTRDVQPERVSFRDQKSANGCKFSPKNLRMGYNLQLVLIHKTSGLINISII